MFRFRRRSPIAHQKLYADTVSLIPLLETCLEQNICDFWLTQGIDRQNGGYCTYIPESEQSGKHHKGLVTQARLLWFFSRVYRSPYGKSQHLKAAKHGYDFFCQYFLDSDYGGFYWLVDSTGTSVLKPDKHLYGQAFALYALSEYFLATGEPSALQLAQDLFNLIERKAHDSAYGGYVESFDSNWKSQSSDAKTYLGSWGNLKLMNTHLHLLESITSFYQVSQSLIARERILELIHILTCAVTAGCGEACFDRFNQDWSIFESRKVELVSYGHTIENIWLIIYACQLIKIPLHPFLPSLEKMFEYSIRYGYDWCTGGLYEAGHLYRMASMRNKIWWIQAELIVSALYLYQLTESPYYLRVFNHTFQFITSRLIDWQHGEWQAVLAAGGKVKGMKADLWKAPYHNGRAVLECLSILKKLSKIFLDFTEK